MPAAYQGTVFRASGSPIIDLVPPAEVAPDQQRARLDLLRRADTNCKCEMAIVNCIGHIAEQSYEVAEEIILCLEGSGCANSAAAGRAREQRHKTKQPRYFNAAEFAPLLS